MADQPAPTTTTTGVDAAALEEVVTYTSELIRIDTTNRGGGDCRERPAAEYAAERLAERRTRPGDPGAHPGRGNVVARIMRQRPERRRPPRPRPPRRRARAGRGLDQAPLLRRGRGRRRLGRGAVDMKNMDAMILALARSWARTGVRPRRDLVIAFTADEEASAEDGSDFLADRHADLFEGCTEGISESGAFTFHDGSGREIYPIAVERTRHRLAGADRARPRRARLQGQPLQRCHPPRRRRRPHRQPRVAGPPLPDGPGRPHRTRRPVRHRGRPGRRGLRR